MADVEDNFTWSEIQPTQVQIELSIRALKSENWNLEILRVFLMFGSISGEKDTFS